MSKMFKTTPSALAKKAAPVKKAATAAKKPKPKKPVEPPHPKEPVKAEPPKPSGSTLPILGTPPPTLREGDAKAELLNRYPEFTLTLDYGQFHWLWRIVESKALIHFNSATTKTLMPEQLDVSLRTAESFRRAQGSVRERLDLTQRPKKVMRRT